MEHLNGWVFTYNPHIKQWMATTRENGVLLFNDHMNSAVLRSKSFETLQALIIKIKGRPNAKFLSSL